MARLSPVVPFGLVMAFQAWLWPFWPVFGLYNLSHRTVIMVYKRVCRNCPISSCGAKYLVRLANHLADVHQLDHIQRRQYLQEAKLQPKVKVVVYESEADNSGKNHYRNLVQTQDTVHCELSRSQRNEVPLEQKLKDRLQRTRQTERNKKKANSWLRGYRKIV